MMPEETSSQKPCCQFQKNATYNVMDSETEHFCKLPRYQLLKMRLTSSPKFYLNIYCEITYAPSERASREGTRSGRATPAH